MYMASNPRILDGLRRKFRLGVGASRLPLRTENHERVENAPSIEV